MNGMQNNAQVTPQMAELGVAIVQAVQAVLADPKAAAAVAKEYADAQALSVEEIQAYAEARAVIAQAAVHKEDMQNREEALQARADGVVAAEQKIHAQRAFHDDNVKQLNRSVEAHDRKMKLLENREDNVEDAEKEVADRLAAVQAREEAVKAEEAALKARQGVLNNAAKALAAAG